MEYKYSFSGVFETPKDALEAVMASSWSLAMSDLKKFCGCCTPAEFKFEILLYQEDQKFWLRQCYVPHPYVAFEEREGGGFSFDYVTSYGANRVSMYVGRWTECTYTVHSIHTADKSSAVKAFMDAGWIPDDHVAEVLRRAEAAEEASRNAEGAYCWPVERFGRKYLPKRDRRVRKGAGRYHTARR